MLQNRHGVEFDYFSYRGLELGAIFPNDDRYVGHSGQDPRGHHFRLVPIADIIRFTGVLRLQMFSKVVSSKYGQYYNQHER